MISAFNDVELEVFPHALFCVVPGNAVFAAIAGRGFRLGRRPCLWVRELKFSFARKQVDGVPVLFICKAAVRNGLCGHFFAHNFPVHPSGFIPAGIAGIQIGIAWFHIAVRRIHGLAVNFEQFC